MIQNGIDAYLIPSADFHQSEYVGDYFKSRAFISGFTGSAGFALMTCEQACLWTDGRYFIQAEQELEGTGVDLFRMGNDGVPTLTEYITNTLPKGATLGFDGRVISAVEGLNYETLLHEKNGSIRYDLDLISDIWTDRPALSNEPAFHLSEEYTGTSTETKLVAIREKMSVENVTAHVVTSLDDLCWIFNIRGNDISFSPMVLAYAIIYMDRVSLFIDEDKLNDEIRLDLSKNQITYFPYNHIYDYVKNFTSNDSLMIDPAKINYTLCKNIPSETTRTEIDNPSTLMKAAKNETELKNIRAAHIKDGIAVTKYMRWVKSNIGIIPMNEISCAAKLESLRSEQDGYLYPSFSPICAYKEHGAICHYRATPESNLEIKPEGLFLNDTGGNYYEGSTDITRTFAMGPLTDEAKFHFTLVAKSMLTLANTKFVEGVAGHNLDPIARQAFWNLELDYAHGTGHGVGYLLSIHEGPANLRWKSSSGKHIPLLEGMILSDEPGLYIAGSHGIRIENLLAVRKGTKNEFGQFMYFEPLTFAPIDLDAIEPSALSDYEKQLLNDYHVKVWEKLAPHLDDEEQAWLKKYTRAI